MLLRQHKQPEWEYIHHGVSSPRISVLPEVEEWYVFTTCLCRKPSMAVLHVTVVALCFSESYICGCSDVPMDMGSLAWPDPILHQGEGFGMWP